MGMAFSPSYLGEGVADVLRLGGGLGTPADDADLLDVLPRRLKERELVAATLENGLLQWEGGGVRTAGVGT